MSNSVVYHPDYNLVEICLYAFDRSCGHLEFITVEDLSTDDLLKFIAENVSKLRCLRFVNCQRITDNGFCEAVRRLPLLEKLNISLFNLSKDSLEVVGRSCELLKFLIFVRKGFGIGLIGFDDDDDHNDDDEALIIAKTMPRLHHLDIRGNPFTNVGLIAILDGCPLLDTIDIRRCYNLDISRSLEERCIEQIKDLQLPMFHHEEYYHDDYVTSTTSFIDDDDCYDPYDLLSMEDLSDDW